MSSYKFEKVVAVKYDTYYLPYYDSKESEQLKEEIKQVLDTIEKERKTEGYVHNSLQVKKIYFSGCYRSYTNCSNELYIDVEASIQLTLTVTFTEKSWFGLRKHEVTEKFDLTYDGFVEERFFYFVTKPTYRYTNCPDITDNIDETI